MASGWVLVHIGTGSIGPPPPKLKLIVNNSLFWSSKLRYGYMDRSANIMGSTETLWSSPVLQASNITELRESITERYIIHLALAGRGDCLYSIPDSQQTKTLTNQHK